MKKLFNKISNPLLISPLSRGEKRTPLLDKGGGQGGGFTLVEVMIAVTLFSIIMTIGSGAVLNTSATYKKTANLRAAMDNLSFIMEDMARNLRLGSNIHANGNNLLNVAFNPVGGSPLNLADDWIYNIGGPDQDDNYFLEKSKDKGLNFERLTSPDEIEINFDKSGFTVVGVGPGNGQPMITIRLSGKVIYKDLESEFNLQTTVSQRLLEQ